MRRRRIYGRRTAGFTKIKWVLIIVLIFAFAGISCAAQTSAL